MNFNLIWKKMTRWFVLVLMFASALYANKESIEITASPTFQEKTELTVVQKAIVMKMQSALSQSIQSLLVATQAAQIREISLVEACQLIMADKLQKGLIVDREFSEADLALLARMNRAFLDVYYEQDAMRNELFPGYEIRTLLRGMTILAPLTIPSLTAELKDEYPKALEDIVVDEKAFAAETQ
jgi:hypothetical protein